MTETCPQCKVFSDQISEVQTIHLSEKDHFMKIHEARYCDIHGIIGWDPDKDD